MSTCATYRWVIASSLLCNIYHRPQSVKMSSSITSNNITSNPSKCSRNHKQLDDLLVFYLSEDIEKPQATGEDLRS